MRCEFQRDDEVDKRGRDLLAGVIESEPQVYTEEEERIFESLGTRISGFKEKDFEELDSPDRLVKMELGYVRSGKDGVSHGGSERAMLRASAVVDASIPELAAWEMSKMSREAQKVHVARGGLDNELHKVSNHQNIYHAVTDMGIPAFLPREVVGIQLWKWTGINQQELTVVGVDADHAKYPKQQEYVRMSATAVLKCKRLPAVGGVPQTMVTTNMQGELGGVIPSWLLYKKGTELLQYVSSPFHLFAPR
jgi:hypothetical protein